MSSYVKTDKAARGQKIVTSFGRDDSNHKLPNTMGGKMGGSTTNLSHSISGANAKMDGNAMKDKKDTFG